SVCFRKKRARFPPRPRIRPYAPNSATPMNLRALALRVSCGLTSAFATDELIELIESPNSLGPARTLELRFAEEMIPAQDVQKGDAPAPIAITPAVMGKWTWQSTRRGVFSPTQPWPLS